MTTGHGFEFEFGDGVEFIDGRSAGRPYVHFSADEFDAFVRGAQAGDFDLGDDEDQAGEG